MNKVLALLLVVGCASDSAKLGQVEQGLTFPVETAWKTTVLVDPQGDATTSGGRDLVGDATRPACSVAVSGQYFFARLRLDTSPAGSVGVGAFGWAVIIDTDGNLASYEYMISLEGVAGGDDIHFLKNTTVSGGLSDVAETELAGVQNGAAAPYPAIENDNFKITAITTNPFGTGADYFLDFAIPIANFSAAGIPLNKIVQFTCGTSSNGTRMDVDPS
ncbi:MAG TPA: hypothetical protein VK427_01025, partial [Kofleriaceae bacterium]|nr:hypothetical protein [Kofleriaceae bacterium]